MPSVQQFANLWCNSVTTTLTSLTGCPMGSGEEDGGKVLLAAMLPPVGMQKCGYTDTKEVAAIAKSLLYTLSNACVEKSAGDPFHSDVSSAEVVRRDLLEYVNKASDLYFKTAVASEPDDDEYELDTPSELVDGLLSSYVSGKRNMFTQLSTKLVLGDKKEDRVAQLCQELEKLGFWPLQRRENVAKVLIERMDKQNVAHCPELFSMDDEDGFIAHQNQCRFAPYKCPNPGCGKVNSVLHAAEHDEVCPRKPIPCRQKCDMEVPREDMDNHCLTVCAKKPVTCPFKAAGCEEQLLQGDLLQHCQEWVEKHLYFTFLAHQKTANLALDHDLRLGVAEQAVATAEQTHAIDVRTLTQTLKQAESKIKALEADIKKLHKDVKVANNTNEVAQLRSELRSLRAGLMKAPAG